MDVPVADRLIHGHGTAEHTWMRSGALERMPTLALASLVRAARRVVVIAPHPDDEVLGAGGLITMAAQHALPVLVVSVTDGEKSHPERDAAELRACRDGERARALAVLGIGAQSVMRLGIADGGVGQNESLLAATLTHLVRGDDLVVCPWDEDGHPDHEASGRASAQAARLRQAMLLEYPVWGWHWCTPERFPFERAFKLQLDWEAVAAKTHAIGFFKSQTEARAEGAVLSAETLAHFRRPFEVYLR